MTHPVTHMGERLLARFTLRESLVVGLCATFIVLSSLFIYIPSLLPAHKVLAVVFFLLLGRGCVRPALAATVIGLLAGRIALYPGLGRGGPIQLVRYVTAGGLADGLYLLMPAMTGSRLFGSLAGAFMGATWFPLAFLVDLVVGMAAGAAAQHALLKTVSATVFGALGGFLAPTVVRRLRASGLLPPPMTRGLCSKPFSRMRHHEDLSRVR
jgi:hypothetical protein